VLQRGLQVIEDELGPVITEAQDTASNIDQLLRDLGLLLRASSATSLTIGHGEKVFVIAEELRARFAAPLYVIAAVEGEADIWMAGQVTDWDTTTGALTVAVTNTRGEGAFAGWDISIASVPPEIPPAQMAANVALVSVQGMMAAELQSAVEELNGNVEELNGSKAPLASPAFTGEPTAPTAAPETNTTQIATTAFVKVANDTLMVATAPMPGELKAIAGASVPSWAEGQWLLCDGTAVSRTIYADLFGAIGETWGAGDGATTFNLPDLRGRTLVGLDNMGGSAANRVTASGSGIDGDTLGASGGEETHDLTINEMPSHNHGVNDPGHTHPTGVNLNTTNATAAGSYSDFVRVRNEAGATASATTGITIGNNGGGEAHNNMQPSAMVNYLIKT
jgi:microcystin-dependent protein